MPQNKNSSSPPKVMTWKKASPIIVVAAIFDIVRFAFEWFWFFGPALAALYCTVKASDAVGALGGLTEFTCSLAAGAGGFVGAPAIEAFGVMMAMATGFMGWLVIGGWLTMTNSRIFKENASNGIWFGASLLISEVPIIGSLPAISVITWRLYHTQIKKDKASLQKYEEEQAAEQTKLQQQQAVQQMQAQQAQAAQEEMSAAAQSEQEAAEEEEQFQATQPEYGSISTRTTPSPRLATVPNYTGEAANETLSNILPFPTKKAREPQREIPEKVRKAA